LVGLEELKLKWTRGENVREPKNPRDWKLSAEGYRSGKEIRKRARVRKAGMGLHQPSNTSRARTQLGGGGGEKGKTAPLGGLHWHNVRRQVKWKWGQGGGNPLGHNNAIGKNSGAGGYRSRTLQNDANSRSEGKKKSAVSEKKKCPRGKIMGRQVLQRRGFWESGMAGGPDRHLDKGKGGGAEESQYPHSNEQPLRGKSNQEGMWAIQKGKYRKVFGEEGSSCGFN